MINNEPDRIWELVVKKLHNSLNLDEKEEFEQVKNSEEVREKLREAEQIYHKSINSFLIQKIDKEKNWAYILSQIKHGSRVKKMLIQFSGYAAVFIAALLIGALAHKVFISDLQEVRNNSIEMEWGQMGKMTLSDGTKVWLNAGTIFTYPTTFGTDNRSVHLTGEAQFNVTQNDKIPFEVKTETGILKVYGTIFNVSAYQDDPDMIVTLIEGKVVVENNNGDYLATLNPSDQIRINKLNGKFTLQKVDTVFYNCLAEGKLLLNDTKLSDLTKILKRWYSFEIKFMDKKAGDIKISGTIIKNKPLDLFLKVLERSYGIKYEMVINDDKKDEILIYKN
jgi:ferric-dicitrate binding protein FerR (iron transport regulator)